MALLKMTGRVSAARQFAMERHNGQMYGKNAPYVAHLDAVASALMLSGYIFDQNLMCAGYLHDILEDTHTTESELAARFGKEVAELVELVTYKPGRNRRERHAATYPHIRGNMRATTLKLADRLANVWNCYLEGDPRLRMYSEEQNDFRLALYVEGDGNKNLWKSLEDIFFYAT